LICYKFFKNESEFKAVLEFENIISLNDLGVIYRNESNINLAIDYFKKAIEIQQKTSNKKIEGDIYSNLGLCYVLNKQFDFSSFGVGLGSIAAGSGAGSLMKKDTPIKE
jgi:tetratricopeptide (TPR) repeat protein